MDLAKDISAMTIFLGTNDSSLPTNPRRHVPLDEYVGNLVDMVDYLTVSMSRDLVLGDDALLYIAYVMPIWAEPIPATRCHCSLRS